MALKWLLIRSLGRTVYLASTMPMGNLPYQRPTKIRVSLHFMLKRQKMTWLSSHQIKKIE